MSGNDHDNRRRRAARTARLAVRRNHVRTAAPGGDHGPGPARRRHRLSAVAGLSVAGAAAGTALALGLTGVLGPARTPGTIRTASFTLASNSNGTATLTINPHHHPPLTEGAARPRGPAERSRAVRHPGEGHLRQLLLLRSPPGRLLAGRVDAADGAGYLDAAIGCAAHDHDRPVGHARGRRAQRRLLPAQLGRVRGRAAGRRRAHRLDSYTCTSTPPDPNGPPDGYGQSDSLGLLYGGPGPAGS